MYYFNLLSLDVVFGAMAGMLFFSDLLEVKISEPVYILLGMAVWSIYTWDHLMDAQSALGKPQSPRHQFHQKYFRVLLPLVFSCILVGILLFFSLGEMEFIQTHGILLGTFTVVWMGFLKIAGTKLSWLKEISTALIYVLGVSLAPFASLDMELVDNFSYLFIFIYFLAALVNLLILSYLDAEVDQKDGFGSVLVLIPKTGLKNLILLLGMTGIGILLVLGVILPSFYHVHSVILGLIIGYHLILFFSKNQTKDQVRKKSEALFLLPFLLLLF
ncbi:hypothetical protein MMU07_08845 [Aquiflexum sp. LQ15W]|uniref:hypothetical protein n=1 Tax=Cognataquiflexum nitidum TaxID=2922272 RepID=UPI001F1319F1|nr:hypothetical protein [Cognataquiflexum nitidum]MCH6199685.1 hypothetical protein [Cognataquiflexum nitidum]